MLKGCISERLLAFFTTRERAAAIVGDLLELHSGPLGFWFAVMRTTWALSWRFGLGFLLAAPAEYFCLFYPKPTHGVDRIAVLSGWCFALFAASALFSLVRFAASDAITRLSAALALLAGLDLFFWWVPFMRPTIAAMVVIVALVSCLRRRGRAALRRLLCATVAAAAPLIGMMYVLTRALGERCKQGCNLDLYSAPVLVLFPIAFLLSSGIVAVVLGRNQEGRSQLG
jgi:hypothetical protein